MRIHCSRCGKSVSTEVPHDTVIRAWVECPECIGKDTVQNDLLAALENTNLVLHQVLNGDSLILLKFTKIGN